MQITTRRAVLAATAALAGGSLAAAALWRKPEREIFTLAGAKPAGPPAGMMMTAPPVVPAAVDFTDGDGKPHRLAEFAGQGLVVNLWATWCVPCVAEMPVLQVMAARLAAERIVVLPLSSDRGGAAVVRKFYTQHDVRGLGVWLDPKSAAAEAWGARGLPTTLIIDRGGREVARVEGGYPWARPETLDALRRLVG